LTRFCFIIFLIFFLISSVSYSEIITLNNCRYSWEKTFQKDLYKENKIVVDTDNRNISHFVSLIDKNLVEDKRFYKFEYEIIPTNNVTIHNEFQTFKGKENENTINIYLNEKRVEQIINSPLTNKKLSNTIYCD